MAVPQNKEVRLLWKSISDMHFSTADQQQGAHQDKVVVEKLEDPKLRQQILDDIDNLSDHIFRIEGDFIKVRCAIECLDIMEILRKSDGGLLQLETSWKRLRETFLNLRNTAQSMVSSTLNDVKYFVTTFVSSGTSESNLVEKRKLVTDFIQKLQSFTSDSEDIERKFGDLSHDIESFQTTLHDATQRYIERAKTQQAEVAHDIQSLQRRLEYMRPVQSAPNPVTSLLGLASCIGPGAAAVSGLLAFSPMWGAQLLGAAINLGPAPHEYDDVLVNQKEKVSSDDPLKIVLVEVNNLHPDFIDLCSRLSIMAGIKRLLIVGAQRFRDKVDGLLDSTPAGEEPDVVALQIYTQQLTPAYELLLLALEKYCHSCEEPFESRAATQQISMQLRHNSSAWTSSIESGEIGARARKILSDVNTSGKAFDMRQLSASIKPVRWLLQYVNRLVDRGTDLGVDMRRGEWRNYMDDVRMTMKSSGTVALALCEDFRHIMYGFEQEDAVEMLSKMFDSTLSEATKHGMHICERFDRHRKDLEAFSRNFEETGKRLMNELEEAQRHYEKLQHETRCRLEGVVTGPFAFLHSAQRQELENMDKEISFKILETVQTSEQTKRVFNDSHILLATTRYLAVFYNSMSLSWRMFPEVIHRIQDSLLRVSPDFLLGQIAKQMVTDVMVYQYFLTSALKAQGEAAIEF